MSKSKDAFRTISEVAEWLDTQPHVLRFWETKFSQVRPVKRAGGRRYYRPADMMLLGGIKKLLHDDGMTIKGVQKLLREQGIKEISILSKSVDGEEALDEQIEAKIAEEIPEAIEPLQGDPIEEEIAALVAETAEDDADVSATAANSDETQSSSLEPPVEEMATPEPTKAPIQFSKTKSAESLRQISGSWILRENLLKHVMTLKSVPVENRASIAKALVALQEKLGQTEKPSST